MSHDKTFNGCHRIEYRALMSRLADLVGHHQLPINREADSINDFLDGDPVHCDLIRDVVRSIYRAGRCNHLDTEVRAETVFNSLGGIRGRLLADGETDVDQVNLLEELGWASRVLFDAPAAGDAAPQSGGDTDREKQPVILPHPSL